MNQDSSDQHDPVRRPGVDHPANRRAALGVLMPGFSGTSVPQWLHRPLREGLASVCLFAMNTPDVSTTRALCDELAELAPELLIAADEEGGDVSRLQAAEGSALPGSEALGVVDDLDLTREAGRLTGALVRAAGIHLTIAPVLDVTSNPANPVIGVRAFGSDPASVGAHGRAFIEGLHAAGVGAAAKHFPGHGDTAVDSHVGLPVIEVEPQVLAERDVRPFAMVADLVDTVMTAHIVVPAHGPHPATLSTWAYELLRDTGFHGPAITDAVGMAAVAAGDAEHGSGIGQATVRALAAGADLVCLDSPQNRDPEPLFEQALEAVMQALADGTLHRETLVASADRTRMSVRRITARPGWLDDEPHDAERLERFGREVAARALTLTGATTVGPVPAGLVDIRAGHNWAAGDLGSVVLEQFNAHRAEIGAEPLAQHSFDELETLHGPLVVVTKAATSNRSEADQLQRLLSQVPDAVVVHTGAQVAAPQVPNLVCTHGLARPNLYQAARAIFAANTNDQEPR